MNERRARTGGRTAAAIALLVCLAPAQGGKSLVGIREIEPGLVHPIILPKLKERGRKMAGLELGLHASVPMRVTLTRGKRPGEYGIDGEPKLGITRLILPGLVNAKLTYGPKRVSSVRFEIWEQKNELWITNHCGATAQLAGHELTFVDLDHDGALGAMVDGYVVKAPKAKYWAEPDGRVTFRAMSDPLVIEGKKYWLDVDAAGFQMVVADRQPDFTVKREEGYRTALAVINAMRQRLGHEPVTLRSELSRACEEHALYCATNDELTHTQEPSKPGFSATGAKAGRACELQKAASMEIATRSWLDTFYHRLNVLSPNLKRVGMGLMYGVAALDAQSDVEPRAFEPFGWPVDKAVEVPIAWATGETPSPIGETPFTGAVAAQWGYPVSLTFPTAAVKGVEAKLVAGGKELEVFVSSPEAPGNATLPDNKCSILVMSRAPLPFDAEVRVIIRCTHAGKPFHREWTFTTRRRA